MTLNPRRRLAALSVCLCISLLAVSAAAAGRPDDRAMHGVGSVSVSPASDRPDDRATHGVGAVSEAPLPDVFERAVLESSTSSTAVRPDDRSTPRGPGSVAASLGGTITTTTGLSWSDAFVGASAMFALCLLAVAGLLTAARRRGRVAF